MWEDEYMSSYIIDTFLVRHLSTPACRKQLSSDARRDNERYT